MSPEDPPAKPPAKRFRDGERKATSKKQDRIWCPCGTHKDNGTLMIQCETSGVWCHAKCLGYKKARDVPEDFSLPEKHLKALREYEAMKKSGKRGDERQKPHYADALKAQRRGAGSDMENPECDNYLWVQCDSCSAWIVGNKWGFRKESDVPDYFMCDVCEEIEYGTDFDDGAKGGGAQKREDGWHPHSLLAVPMPRQHSAADLEEYRRILESRSDSDTNDEGDEDELDEDSE